MRRFYRSVKTGFTNAYYWILDYLYVAYWQTKGMIGRDDATRYIDDTSGKRIVILIPGIYETWQFMKPVADVLYTHGYSIHVVDSLGYNTGSIEAMARHVQEYVNQNKIKHYDIVAHSKGGLIAKYLLGAPENTIDQVIAIHTPFNGSKYAGLFPLKPIRLFSPTSGSITLLAKDIHSNNKITSIYGIFDPHIPGGSFLEGAKNMQLDTRGHFRVLNDAKVHVGILNSL